MEGPRPLSAASDLILVVQQFMLKQWPGIPARDFEVSPEDFHLTGKSGRAKAVGVAIVIAKAATATPRILVFIFVVFGYGRTAIIGRSVT
jgi:hypothetical protein